MQDIGNTDAQSDINPSCVIRGESHPPPPFVVLRWLPTGECNSTIDHFVLFYDIRTITSNGNEYILFLESQ